MRDLPVGTVTFLFADVEKSTLLLQRLGDGYASVLADFFRMARAAVRERSGRETGTAGDSLFAVFGRAHDALASAIAIQRALRAHPWPPEASLRARIAIHTGEADPSDTGFVGIDVHRAARICAAGHGGQILLSEATHALVAGDLPDGVSFRDLGEYRLKDLAHPDRLFQVLAADLPVEFPPPNSPRVHLNNLPAQLTTFIGREEETHEVRDLLTRAHLLTLTGAGGCGKTRLALRVAEDSIDQYTDGVWMVDLSSLSDPALVPQTVAVTLGVPEQPGRGLNETLTQYLRPKSLLLVLDNCEHVLSACQELVDMLLRACSKLRILATSRELLGVEGELVYRVPSLRLPDPRETLPPADIGNYEAIRLFVDRAALATPRFTLTAANAAGIAQLCRRLDGIPLAIEFAAARARVLAVEQIAARLDDRFRLLTSGSRKALPRQQTLRATIDWSYDLLSDQEKVLLDRLSVFAGGWTLDAAEIVCSDGGPESLDILNLLTRLVDKSLVVFEAQERESRYRLLETVRQYARERLIESGEMTTTRRRHRDWCIRLAERAEPELRGPDQLAWLERLELEHNNLRSGLEFSRTDDAGWSAFGQLAGALHWFWYLRGYWSEGRTWLEEAVTHSTEIDPPILPRVLHGAAILMRRQADYSEATPLCEKGLKLSRELGDKKHTAWFLLHFGATAINRDHYDEAEAVYQEMLAVCRELGDPWFVSVALIHLGEVATSRHDYDLATSRLTEALRLLREVGDKAITAYVLRNLGEVALSTADYDRAGLLYGEGLTLASEVKSKREIEECLEGLAQLASARGQHKDAALLFGAAETLREIVGRHYEPHARAAHDRSFAEARAALGDAVLAAAWAEGRAMRLEDAVAYGLTMTHNIIPGPRAS